MRVAWLAVVKVGFSGEGTVGPRLDAKEPALGRSGRTRCQVSLCELLEGREPCRFRSLMWGTCRVGSGRAGSVC